MEIRAAATDMQPCIQSKAVRKAPLFFKTIGSEGNKKRQVVSVTVCRPCTVFSCYLGSYLSSMGKRRFFIYDFEAPKNGFWAAKKRQQDAVDASFLELYFKGAQLTLTQGIDSDKVFLHHIGNSGFNIKGQMRAHDNIGEAAQHGQLVVVNVVTHAVAVI